MSLKLPGCDLAARVAQPLGEQLIKPIGFGGRRRIRKRWPVTFTAIAVESKLRNYEKRAANVRNRSVHFALCVIENAQVSNLIGKRLSIRFIVLLADSQKDAQAPPDLSSDLVAHGDARFGDSLNDSPHAKLVYKHDRHGKRGMEKWRSIEVRSQSIVNRELT